MIAFTRRDLAVIPVDKSEDPYYIVTACDSCGAIGEKSGDVFKLSPRYAAKFTLRVVLTELMCCGAKPLLISNGVACEMHPTGEETILGIHDELNNAGIKDISLIGSTEENFVTSMTALAISATGIAIKSELKFDEAFPGDKIILFGTPRVGAEVDLESKGFYEEIRRLLRVAGVREIVPVGSKGIAYEAQTLAGLNKMAYKPYKTNIDQKKSAGPATCLLVLCEESSVKQVLEVYSTTTIIGEVIVTV